MIKTKVNLREQLEKERQGTMEKVEAIVDSTRLLMAAEEKEDRAILSNLGLDTNLQAVEVIKGINLERARFEKTFETKVFTEEEIKSIALDYGLRFLPTKDPKNGKKRFVGALDSDVVREVKRFAKINNLDITENFMDSSDGKKFYILAPPDMFNLEDRPVEPTPTFLERLDAYLDPAMFYKVSEDKYALVHQWGNDFSIWRLVNNWRKRNLTNMVIHRQIAFTGISATALAAFGVVGILPLLGFGFLIGAFANAVYTSAQESHLANMKDYDGNRRSIHNEDLWNSPYKN